MYHKEKIIGLTGGIGSGKTTVSDKFSQLGIDIIDADVIARQIVSQNSQVKAAITATFGHTIINPAGNINRQALRELIFSDPAKKQQLEKITHPAIRHHIELALTKDSHSPYKIFSSPLLFETQQTQLVNKIVVVDVPQSVQISRSCSRDKQSEHQIKSIINMQLSRDDKLKQADYIIDNSQDLEYTYKQVLKLHQQLLNSAF